MGYSLGAAVIPPDAAELLCWLVLLLAALGLGTLHGMLAKTGLTIADHQRLTIERYDALLGCETGVYVMPVLQGYAPQEYVSHIRQYGDRLRLGAWVGVGSVCKRNANPRSIEAVLTAIKRVRPDLKLHGFGVKLTALASGVVRQLLYSADSMAWSFAARRRRRNPNCWKEARAFVDLVESQSYQLPLFLELSA